MKSELYEKFFIGSLSESETSTLTGLIEEDSQVADELVDFVKETSLMVTCAGLLESNAVSDDGTTLDKSPPQRQLLTQPSSTNQREPEKPTRFKWRSSLTAVACIAVVVVAGVLAFQNASPKAIAHITAASAEIQIVRGEARVSATVGQSLFPGDRVVTKMGQELAFVYLNEKTNLIIRERTDLEFESSSNGKRMKLMSGSLFANVAPQPAGKPMRIATPLTTTLVKGTRFLLTASPWHTHLEVTEGLVQLTRLSDEATQDVAADQYVLATEQNKLAVLSVGERPTPMKHRYGKILFKDEFDTNLDAFDIVEGTQDFKFEKATSDTSALVEVAKRGQFFVVRTKDFVVLHKKWRLKLAGDKYEGIRSRQPIQAKRFVVEARHSLYARDGKKVMLLTSGIEVEETKHLLGDAHAQRANGQWQILRWEFLPIKNATSSDQLLCHFYGGTKGEQFIRSSIVRFSSKKVILASLRGAALFDYVIVREILED